jgi:hypothetical protein
MAISGLARACSTAVNPTNMEVSFLGHTRVAVACLKALSVIMDSVDEYWGTSKNWKFLLPKEKALLGLIETTRHHILIISFIRTSV